MKKYISITIVLSLMISFFASCSTLGEEKTEESSSMPVLEESSSPLSLDELEESIDITAEDVSEDLQDELKNASIEESSEAEVEKVYTKADVDGNGKITADDYILLKRAIFGMTVFNDEQKVAGDLNNNGKLDPTDYICLKRIYFGTANLEDILNGKPVEDESSEDVLDVESSEIVEESSDGTHGEYESDVEESSEVDSTPSESVPVESEIESSEIIEESSKEESSEHIESSEESSEPIEESSETEPVISTIPSVPSEDDPIENDPVEESSEAESSNPTEESTPTENEDPFAKYHVPIESLSEEEAESLIEECILMYINKYRVEEGKCEMTMLTGKSRAFARGRSVQLTKNFAHDVDAMRELATELEYGKYVEARPDYYYDFEKEEFVYTGEMTEPYYQYVGGEAISKTTVSASMYISQVAESIAAGIFTSSAHWYYVGNNANIYAAIGFKWNCACILVLDTNEYD